MPLHRILDSIVHRFLNRGIYVEVGFYTDIDNKDGLFLRLQNLHSKIAILLKPNELLIEPPWSHPISIDLNKFDLDDEMTHDHIYDHIERIRIQCLL